MKEQMLEVLGKSSTTLSVTQIIFNFIIAFVLGGIIFLSYRTSHTRIVYSARFNVSLLMLTMITTLVMSVIGNNIALSLGMVGAMSIVRFRTSVKDPRDTAYIFWCIAIGICCGVADYIVAAIGTVFIFVLLVVFGMVQDNQRYLLVVRSERKAEWKVKEIISTVSKNKAVLKVHNSTIDSCEYIYEMSNKMLNKMEKMNTNIVEAVREVEGIQKVDLVMQTDDMR